MLGILFFGCKKQNIEPKLSDDFCLYATRESVDGTIPIINKYLNSFDKNVTDSIKLVKLVASLQNKDCINNATLVCYCCVYTMPPCSEIYVMFKFDDGGENLMNLCLRHDDPLQAIGYHQIMTNE